MIILEKIKYIYMFSFLIIFMSSFIIVSFKITCLILPIVEQDNYPIYGGRIKYLIKEVKLTKLIFLSFIGVVTSILIFILINDSTLIEISNKSSGLDFKSKVIEYINQFKL